MNKYYTGVGSRETPLYIRQAMTYIAGFLEAEGYILRSGGADGADLAFESGVRTLKEIYIPWRGFNNSFSPLNTVCDAAMAMALTIHPAPGILKNKIGAWKLHARNCYQVLGEDLNTPSDFLIGYTADAKDIGGTRTALVLARRNNIPILNLGVFKTYQAAVSGFDTFYMIHAA